MLESWIFLDSPIVCVVILAVITPFLVLLFFMKTAAYWARRQITAVPSPRDKQRQRVAVIARDEEFIHIISTLSHVEKFSAGQKSLATIKNKTRLMLRLRKRVIMLFPEMSKEEVEQFCGHLHDLTKSVSRKKNR